MNDTTNNTVNNSTENQQDAQNVAEESMVATPKISIDDFCKVEMKIGKVLTAERVEGSDKLLKLSVDFAESTPRQVLSGIGKAFTPEDIIGQSFPFVTNLQPRKIMGMESQAMILAVSDDSGLALLKPTKDIVAGTHLS